MYPRYRRMLSCSSSCFSSLDWLDQQLGHADSSIYASILRRCGNARALSEGERVHGHIVARGFESDTFLSNLIVEMYGKCGSLENASAVFERMVDRNVFSWTMMIAAYAQNGHSRGALHMFKRMDLEGVKPDKITYVGMIRVCCDIGDVAEGEKIHARIVHDVLESDVVVSTALVNLYGKCGNLEDARNVFDRMHCRDVVCWTAMLDVYLQRGHYEEGLELYWAFQLEGMKANEVTFVSVLSACAGLKALPEGKLIHSCIVESRYMSNALRNTLINFYGKCGQLEEAVGVFGNMHVMDVVSWNVMIAAYAQQGHHKEAADLYRRMDLEGVKLDELTFISVMDACGGLANESSCKAIHLRVVATGVADDQVVISSLISMFGKCGYLDDARSLLDSSCMRNLVSCTAMISAYVQHSRLRDAIDVFYRLQQAGMKPNKITFVNILGAFASPESLAEGKVIHARIVQAGLHSDVVVSNALINMYGKCGSLLDAKKAFDDTSQKNVVSWNSVIAGCMQQGHAKDALEYYRKMDVEGVMPNKITLISMLDACVQLGALREGKAIHDEIIRSGVELDDVVSSSLVNMYAKCGNLADTRNVFNKVCWSNVVPWTAMVAAYAQHGHWQECLKLCRQMDMEGIKFNDVTFLIVLFACSHAGFVEQGCHYLVTMTKQQAMTPTLEQYGCMVDLLGRAGWLKEAEELIEGMAIPPDSSVWLALLGACKIHGDVPRAIRAAQKVLSMDPRTSAPYVLLSNIYAEAEMLDDLLKLRKS